MKKLTILLALIIFITASSSVLKPSIVGTWKYISSNDSKINYVRFAENNDYYYIVNGKKVAGEPFIKYTYNDDKDPAWIDLKGYGLSGDKIFVWEGLARMVDKNHMTILINKERRPRSFADNANAELIMFERISK